MGAGIRGKHRGAWLKEGCGRTSALSYLGCRAWAVTSFTAGAGCTEVWLVLLAGPVELKSIVRFGIAYGSTCFCCCKEEEEKVTITNNHRDTARRKKSEAKKASVFGQHRDAPEVESRGAPRDQLGHKLTLYVEIASPQLCGSGRLCGLELIFPEAKASMMSQLCSQAHQETPLNAGQRFTS